MKCILCNERNGSTRCEGCQQLYCLPCMNKHHEELAQQFQLLTDVRNELKQSLDIATSTSKNSKTAPCIVEIDRWEQEIVQRIREIAAKARTGVGEIMVKNMAEIQHRLEKLSVDIQQRQKEGNHMENDIDTTKNQLDQLRRDIEYVNKRIRVDCTISNNTEWDTLIYIIEDESSKEALSKSIQKNSTDTKEVKKESIWAKPEPLRDTTSSSTAAPREQAAAGIHFCHTVFLLQYL
jgi:cell division protein FtsB